MNRIWENSHEKANDEERRYVSSLRDIIVSARMLEDSTRDSAGLFDLDQSYGGLCWRHNHGKRNNRDSGRKFYG